MLSSLSKAWKSRTIWASFILIVFAPLEAHFSMLENFVGKEFYAYSYIVIGIIFAWLRFITTKSLSEK